MEEWKKIQKTYKIRELIGITGMIMSFVIGAICDWNVLVQSNILIPREYPKVCVNLQTDVRYNYSVWRLFLWQEEKTAHKKQQ